MFVRNILSFLSNVISISYKEANIDTTSLTILNIERPFPESSVIFDISIKVNPFIGSHNTIGEDILTIRISPSDSSFELLNYKHVYGEVRN